MITFVCRTAKNVILSEADWLDEIFLLSQLDLQPGEDVELSEHLFTE